MNKLITQDDDRQKAEAFFVCKLCGIDVLEEECEVTEDGEIYCLSCYEISQEDDDLMNFDNQDR